MREGSTTMWDATLYLRFGGERARPFFDLLARVGAELPGYVVDMGCGPGNLTVMLAERWPAATVCAADDRTRPAARARGARGGPAILGIPGVFGFGHNEPRPRAVLHARRCSALGAGEPAGCDHLQRGAAVGARPSGAADPLGGAAG